MNKCSLTPEQIVEEVDVYTDCRLSDKINRKQYAEAFAEIRKLVSDDRLPPEKEKALRLYIREKKKELNGIKSGRYDPSSSSNPLQALSVSGMTLLTLRVFDTILCRLNEKNDNERTVTFDVPELLDLFELKEYDRDVFSDVTDNLFQTVTIDRGDDGFTIIALFEGLICDGKTAEIICSESARELLFTRNNIEYLHFRLDNALKFTSRNSYMLFFYLADKSVIAREWTVSISELRDVLGFDFIDYTGSILLRLLGEARKEIEEKTDLRFRFEPVFDNEKLKAVKFIIDNITLPKAVKDNLLQMQSPD